jgi:hypothetical protein
MFHTDAFRDQLVGGKPATVSLDVGHQRDTPVGHAVELKNVGSSLFGVFRIHNTPDGDEALERIHDGTLTSVSIRFTPLASSDVDASASTGGHTWTASRSPPRLSTRRPRSSASEQAAAGNAPTHPHTNSSSWTSNGSTRSSAR